MNILLGKLDFLLVCTIILVLVCIYDFVVSHLIKKEKSTQATEEKRSTHAAGYAANWNDKPWKSDSDTANNSADNVGNVSLGGKISMFYEKAPRRANLKRIIWTEQKNNQQAIKDLLEYEQNADDKALKK